MKILVTGATGYIGRRLLMSLLNSEKKISIRLLVSDSRQLSPDIADKVEIIEGNTFNSEALQKSLKGIHTAYYLIHSMSSSKGDFEDLDRKSATAFINEAAAAGVKRVIYLGGLGERDSASRHLASRQETGEILSSYPDKIETIWFRAAVIIGAGGASFEIIRNLVEKIPVMIAPAWVNTLTQPVAVDDVILYLKAASKLKRTGSRIIDIGGERMSFLQMLKKAAEVSGLKRFIIPVPFFSPKLSSYWLILLTPVPFKLASALVAGLKSESIVKNSNAAALFPEIKPIQYEESLRRALAEEEHEILSSWRDGSGAWFNSGKKAGELAKATLRISSNRSIEGIDRKKIWESVTSMGGENGWLSMNTLWRIRGHVDKITGGPGINRGRRSSRTLRIGDSLDFWKVVDIIPGRRLLLFSQMKLPGKGWLEFILDGSLIITAHFIPSGLYGRIYWFLLYPFHQLIFRIMTSKILKAGSKHEV
jgi:uncharacterized protein YbjT (DUF2867 family)